MRLKSGAALALSAAMGMALIHGQALPEIRVRLSTPVSTVSSPPGTRIAGMTIASPLDADAVLPAGCPVSGVVAEEPASLRRNGRAAMQLRFDQLQDAGGNSYAVTTRVVAVDDAREAVTPDGVILGLEPVRRLPSKKEDVLLLAAHAHPFLLLAVEGIQLARREGRRPEIAYDAGTDLRLRVLDGAPARIACAGPSVAASPADDTTRTGVPLWPARTETGSPPRDADWINLAFVGTRAALEQAFESAGWNTAAGTSLRADVKTFMAVAKQEGYRTGPVSMLTLGSAAPALVFQKQNNTFAKRHHIRIWSSSFAHEGEPVWLAAATHDTGIEFSREGRNFTHRIDGDIDSERANVLGDLALTGRIDRYAMVERPAVPRKSTNAAGDGVTTDGRIAVVFMAGQD